MIFGTKKEIKREITKSDKYSSNEITLHFSLTKKEERIFLELLKMAVVDVEKSINKI